jgi:hypothetical protein
MQSWKGLLRTNTLAYWALSQVIKMKCCDYGPWLYMNQESYAKHFIFFVTYEWDQLVSVALH